MKKFEIYLVAIVILFLALPMISAWDFDNVKSYDKADKKITIINAFGLGRTLAEYKLTENTDRCFINCYAEGTAILYNPERLFTKLRFKNIKKDWIGITSSKIYIKDKGKWIEYDGSYLEGTYEWRIEGKKKANETVDWIASAVGEDLTEWAWWNTTFYKKKPITITENSATILTNYSVNITVAYDSAMQADFADIRFTNTSETEELSYWIESKTDSDTAQVWVKIDVIPASSSNDIYMYYDNMTAVSSTSSFNDAFQYGDDFETNLSDRYVNSSACTLFSVSGGNMFINKTGNGPCNIAPNKTYQAESLNNSYIVEVNISINHVDLWAGVFGYSNTTDRSFGYVVFIDASETQWGIYATEAPGAWLKKTSLTVGANKFHLIDLRFSDNITMTNITAYFNDTQSSLSVLNASYGPPTGGYYGITIHSGAGGAVPTLAQVGWFRVRQIAIEEPTYSFGSESQNIGLIIESETYNSTTAETATESFKINVTWDDAVYTNISAIKWVYDSTVYTAINTAGNGNNSEWTYSNFDITGSGTKNFHWQFAKTNATGTYYSNSSDRSITVTALTFRICNATVSESYINISFKDESNLTSLSSTIDSSTWYYWVGDGSEYKSYSYSTSSSSINFTFCLDPPDRTLHHNVSLQYSSTGYPQRRWNYDTDLTNTTTEKILYLLNTGDGIYSIYQVQTTIGKIISGVAATAERQISGTWTLMEEGNTDDAGAVTFWLNPDYDHRLIFSKIGYTTQTITLRPSSTTYTIVMASSIEENATYNSSIEGIRWTVRPPSGILTPNHNYTFEFNVTNSQGANDITACKMELLDNSSNVLSTTTGCTAVGGNLSVLFNVSNYRNIRGKYSLDIGAGYFTIDADAYWILMIVDIPERGTLKAFFTHLRDIDEFGDDDGRKEFSRIILFFLILTIVLGFLSYTTGWDFSTMGGCVLLLYPIIAIASYSGFFTLSYLPDTGTNIILRDFMQKYLVAFVSGLLSLGFMFHKLAGATK